MAYLGNAPARSFISFERQVFTIVNSQTAYTLDHSVNNENDLRLVINNIVQEPGSGKAYTASGTTLTLSAALTNGTDEMYCVFLGRATATNAPGSGSVNTAAIAADAITEAKIADDAVESEHLNDNVISGQTELASAPASTDELLISDGGTLKRIDVSLVGGTNTPNFFAKASGDQAIAASTATVMNFATEVFDNGSCYDGTNKFTVPSGEGGVYAFFASYRLDSMYDGNQVTLAFLKNGSRDDRSFLITRVPSDNTSFSSGISAIFNLSASDYIQIEISQTNSSSRNTGAASCTFGGFKLIT
tara:strand:+ start:43 stop:951 length:909 start_codon:yes stop_codon:yes gene_type:complete